MFINLTFNINLVSNGRTPSRMSCIISGTSAPDATLKYFKLSRATLRFTPYREEKCAISAGVDSGRIKALQCHECNASECRVNCESINYIQITTHMTHIIFEYTFDCTSDSVPIQCRQKRNAAALSLNPPKLALAGLSADTTVTVPLYLQGFPLI